jgi:hypothetical protein
MQFSVTSIHANKTDNTLSGHIKPLYSARADWAWQPEDGCARS